MKRFKTLPECGIEEIQQEWKDQKASGLGMKKSREKMVEKAQMKLNQKNEMQSGEQKYERMEETCEEYKMIRNEAQSRGRRFARGCLKRQGTSTARRKGTSSKSSTPIG